jgi:hypothetical protein
MDTVLFLEKVERADTDVSFMLEFRKARERTPETRADFADINVALVENAWTYGSGDSAPRAKPSPAGAKFLDALVNVLAGSDVVIRDGRRCTTMESWRRECLTLGLLDRHKEHSARTIFARNRRDLVACNRVACNDDHAWTI